MKCNPLSLSLLGGTALILIGIVGCSQKNPMSPIQNSALSSLRTGIRAAAGETELFGQVATIDPTSRTMTLTGSTVMITVAANAIVESQSGGSDSSFTLDQIKMGDSAEVRGIMQAGGNLLADRVRIHANGDANGANEVEFNGRIISLDSAEVTVKVGNSNVDVFVTATTEIEKKTSGTDSLASFSDLAIMDSVEIRGTLRPDSSVQASRIRVRVSRRSEFESEIELRGTIASIDSTAGTLMLVGRTETITTDSLTKFLTKGSNETRHMNSASLSGGDDNEPDSNMVRISLASHIRSNTFERTCEPANAGA